MSSKRKRPRKRQGRGKQGKRSPFNIWLIVGVAFLFAFIVIFLSLRQSSQVGSGQYEEYPAEWVSRNRLGNPDATVTVQAWDDFL